MPSRIELTPERGELLRELYGGKQLTIRECSWHLYIGVCVLSREMDRLGIIKRYRKSGEKLRHV